MAVLVRDACALGDDSTTVAGLGHTCADPFHIHLSFFLLDKLDQECIFRRESHNRHLLSSGRPSLALSLLKTVLQEHCALDSKMYGFPSSVKALCCFMFALKQNDVRDWFKAIDLLNDQENVSVSVKDCWSVLSAHSESFMWNKECSKTRGPSSASWRIPAFL